MPRERYTITLTRPAGCSVSRMKAYIAEAVEAWSGQYEAPNSDNDWTGDPLFGWEPKITVRRENAVIVTLKEPKHEPGEKRVTPRHPRGGRHRVRSLDPAP